MTKTKIIIITTVIISILIIQSTLRAQTFKIKTNVIEVNLSGVVKPASRIDLTHTVKHQDKYYCFFEEKGLHTFSRSHKYFLIISQKGKILNSIELPEEIQNTIYYDFFIRSNRLLVKTYMKHESFVFDTNRLKWRKIKEVDDKVFEDDNYKITYLDFGEWGKTTWFIDKKTKNEYRLSANGTTVNNFEKKYYLTNLYNIIKINDPKELEQCDKNNRYKEVEKKKRHYDSYNLFKGIKYIYQDTTYNPWTFEMLEKVIITSFVTDNQFYQLYSDKKSTYIGKIEKGKLIPIQNLGKRYSTFNWNYSYRGKNLNNYSRFIQFKEDNNTYGFIEINKNTIQINVLKHNQDSLEYLGTDSFEKLISLINEKNDISINQMIDFERRIGGVEIKDDKEEISHNGFYPKKYASKEFRAKRFIKVQNNTITQETEYLYDSNNEIVKSIFIDWSRTTQYTQPNIISFSNLDSKLNEKVQFQKKLEEVKKILIEEISEEPIEENRGNDNFKFVWNLNNEIEIKLYSSKKFKNSKSIRMIINLK